MNTTLHLGSLANISTFVLPELASPTSAWFSENGKFITTAEFVVSVLFYCCVFLAILVGNVLVILAYERNWRLQTTTNTFIIGLAVSDLLVGFVSIPFWLYVYSCHYLDVTLHPVGYEMYITFDVFIGCASIFQLTAISIERCIAIVWPIRHRALREGIFHAMILAAWGCSAVMAGLYPVQLKHWEGGYTAFIFSTCFIGPLIVMSVVYFLIYETARDSRSRVHAARAAPTIHREIRVAGTVALVTGVFMIAWFPFFVVTVVATYDLERLPEPPGLFRLIAFVKALHYINSALNPILYGCRNPEMRKTMLNVVRQCDPLRSREQRYPSRLQAMLDPRRTREFLPGTSLAVQWPDERRSTPIIGNNTTTTVVSFVNRDGYVESRPTSVHQ